MPQKASVSPINGELDVIGKHGAGAVAMRQPEGLQMNESVAPSGVIGLEPLIITRELDLRLSRTPEFKAENLALVALAQHLSDAPENILQSLAETALALCHAGSAGISLFEESESVFRWHGLAGELGPRRLDTTPREFSPCGTVLDRGCTMLMSYPERYFPYFAEVKPTIVEALLVPFDVGGKLIGTVWAVSHDERLEFDAEDQRILRNLAKFASACYQASSWVAAVEAADRRKDEFLAMLGHELRNPLFPLQNAIQYLIKAGPDEHGANEAKGVIQRQLAHMSRLIDDLLDAARISNGKIELRKERIELSAAVRNALEMSRPLIQAARHAVTVSLPAEPVYLDADLARLAQVLSNLLGNAAKYMNEGGQIRVLATIEGSEVVVRVQDDGIGIAADKLASIFELFSQVDTSAGRSHGGLGIGLTLVRTLVNGHGGTVEAHSAGRDRGSEFLVRLPIDTVGRDDSPVQQLAHRQPAVAPPSSLRILVADDNRDAADSLAMVLRLAGHTVWNVYDGQSALATAFRCRPHVVLNDIGMPGVNGYEVARRLREHPGTRDSVLVAVTGYVNADDHDRSREAGFDHHLSKPVDFDSLEKLLVSIGAAGRHAAVRNEAAA
jgi:signal transduction histidine kinase/CheY-like chemotaxis protein